MDPKIHWPDLALMYGLIFQLDANRVNARGDLPSISELEEWHRRGAIGLEWSNPVYNQLARSAPEGRRWKKVCGSLVANPAITTEPERRQLAQIEEIVFPGGPCDDGERVDALALFTARKYRAIFVTNDGGGGKPRGILTSRTRLAAVGVRVVTDDEAVALVRQTLEVCAGMERDHAERFGESLPDWITAWESLRTANKALQPMRAAKPNRRREPSGSGPRG